jgi:hypothetical protein
MKKKNIQLVLICLGIASIGILSRFTDVPNLNALPAIALMLGAFAKRRTLAIGVVFGAMLVSDLYFGFHWSMWAVYLSYALIVLMGRMHPVLKGGDKDSRKSKVLGAGVSGLILSTVSAVLFFLVTNAAVWMESFVPGSTHAMYSPDLSGLVASYAAGLAFARDFGYPVLTGAVLFTVPSFMLYSYFSHQNENSLSMVRESNS